MCVKQFLRQNKERKIATRMDAFACAKNPKIQIRNHTIFATTSIIRPFTIWENLQNIRNRFFIDKYRQIEIITLFTLALSLSLPKKTLDLDSVHTRLKLFLFFFFSFSPSPCSHTIYSSMQIFIHTHTYIYMEKIENRNEKKMDSKKANKAYGIQKRQIVKNIGRAHTHAPLLVSKRFTQKTRRHGESIHRIWEKWVKHLRVCTHTHARTHTPSHEGDALRIETSTRRPRCTYVRPSSKPSTYAANI